MLFPGSSTNGGRIMARLRREWRSETGSGDFLIGEAIAHGSWQHDYVQEIPESITFVGQRSVEGFQKENEWTVTVLLPHAADLPQLEEGDETTLQIGEGKPDVVYFV